MNTGHQLSLTRILRSSPSYFAFLSGVVITVSLDLFLGIFSGEELPSRWLVMLICSILTFISALLWTIIALKLETIQSLAFVEAPKWMEIDDVWQKLITPELPTFRIYLAAAVASAAIGLAVLPIGLKV